MNIPLDRLYHYIRDIAQEIYGDRVIIYRFCPNGSKNINDLNNLEEIKGQSLGQDEWYKKTVSPSVWCNDQEPLDYEFYKTNLRTSNQLTDFLKSIGIYVPPKNLNYQKNIFEKGLLLHSEKRSLNLKKYQDDNELIPVYYWSHALIARDWFRYAEHTKQHKQVTKTFLVYNRAWSGTREYRLRFLDLIVRLGLEKNCQASVTPIEPELGIHYEIHQFKNPAWRPTNVLENFFPTSTAHSHYSADFDIEDYEATDIEIVLETLFDDNRLHLTEKSLRPIACAQPFILASTPDSLEYLRSYGFKTFGHVWDERYDHCEDPEERLGRIADLMKQIANWSPEIRERKMAQAQAIADYNKQHFFSKEFFNLINEELKTNLYLAFDNLEKCNNYKTWVDHWTAVIAHPEINKILENIDDDQGKMLGRWPTVDRVTQVLELIQNKLLGNK